MNPERRRFTSDEVTEIVRRSLESSGSHDDVSYEELEDIAGQSGISPGRLQAAIDEHDTRYDIEQAKARFRKQQRDEFFQHFRAYCIVNGALLLMNLLSSPSYLWFLWPMVGWGIGLAFHASDALYPSEASVEKGAHKLLRRQEKLRAKAIYDRI